MGNSQKNPNSFKVRANVLVAKILKRDKNKDLKVVKVLILGSGESGKTTLLKQLRIIHKHPFSLAEQEHWKNSTYQNIVENIRTLMDAAKQRELQFSHPESVEALSKLTDNDQPAHTYWDEQLGALIGQVWKDEAIQTCFTQYYNDLHLPDSAQYFFNDIARINKKGYLPTEEDLVRCRVRTTGIHELKVKNPTGGEMVIIDVGGQVNERKVWIHSFQCVNAVIYVVPVADYDKKMWEDDETNRLLDSLQLFREISNNKMFSKSAIIVMFNKIDLFTQKITKVDLSICFKEYSGGKAYDPALKYIQEKFKTACNLHKELYMHPTCATDTKLTGKVFESIRATILNQALGDTGFD